jgi:biotin carboxyl carrier protein
VANRREQNLLREQARLTARTVAAAIQTRDEAREARVEADQEVADRQCLYEEGVLTEQALERGIQHADELTRALEQAEEELSETQEGYARIARRIRALEQEAALAAAETEAAASAVEDPVEPDEDTTPLAPAPLEEMTTEEEQPPALPPEVRELAAPRWEEVAAPGMGLIADVVAPPGSLVEEGQELLELADVELARLTAGVRQRDMPEFWTGRTVTVTFEDYPAVALKGWVASCSPTDDGDDAEVEFLLLCERGPFADDAYLAVHWMALEAGVRADAAGAHRLEPLPEPGPASRTQTHLRSLFPLADPWGYAQEPPAPTDCLSRTSYAGRLRLDPMPAVHDGRPSSPRRAAERRRLSALRDWRATYIEGMSTTILDDGTALTYPREGEVSRAVRRIIEGRVSHRANLCARTMREALGWGLGDAHAWARRLPHMDYAVRSDGLARPGDILVWPFTYGPGRAEHIGIAVRQGRRLMLLSNLGGRLGTSEVLGGYLAFYRRDEGPNTS